MEGGLSLLGPMARLSSRPLSAGLAARLEVAAQALAAQPLEEKAEQAALIGIKHPLP